MTILLISLLLICVAWAVTAGVLIARDLKRRGASVDFLWLRMRILKYVGEYRRLTLQETGRVGPLFYHYVIPWCVATVLAVILVARELGN